MVIVHSYMFASLLALPCGIMAQSTDTTEMPALQDSSVVQLDSAVTDSLLRIYVRPEVQSRISVLLYNDTGDLVLSESVGRAARDTVTEFTLDISELPVGAYMLNVQIESRPHGFIIYRRPGGQGGQ